jgi:hypothetical protein
LTGGLSTQETEHNIFFFNRKTKTSLKRLHLVFIEMTGLEIFSKICVPTGEGLDDCVQISGRPLVFLNNFLSTK